MMLWSVIFQSIPHAEVTVAKTLIHKGHIAPLKQLFSTSATCILELLGTTHWGGSKQMSCPVTFCYSDCLWIFIWGLWQGFLFDGFNYDHGDIHSTKEAIKSMLEYNWCGRNFYSDYKQWNTLNKTNDFDRKSWLFLWRTLHLYYLLIFRPWERQVW